MSLPDWKQTTKLWREIQEGAESIVAGGHFLTHNYPHPRERAPAVRRNPLRYKPSLVSHRVLNKSRPIEHLEP